MTALWVIGAVLAALILLALLRFGASVQYDENGLSLVAFAGPVRIRILPASPKSKEKAAEKKKAKKRKLPPKSQIASGREKTAKGGSVRKFKALLAELSVPLGRLRRRLLINELTVRYEAAASDPAKAAMAYGCANAAMAALLPPLENAFRIRKRELSATVDFDSSKSAVYARLKLSMALWEAVYIAAGLDIKRVKAILNNSESTDGSAADASNTDSDNTGKVETING